MIEVGSEGRTSEGGLGSFLLRQGNESIVATARHGCGSRELDPESDTLGQCRSAVEVCLDQLMFRDTWKKRLTLDILISTLERAQTINLDNLGPDAHTTKQLLGVFACITDIIARHEGEGSWLEREQVVEPRSLW